MKDLQEFVEFFAQPEVMGEEGFLSDSGLIPLTENEYNEMEDAILSQYPMRVYKTYLIFI